MDERSEPDLEHPGASVARVVVVGSAATVVAAMIALAAYLYLRRKSDGSPDGLLRHCRSAIEELERSLDFAHA